LRALHAGCQIVLTMDVGDLDGWPRIPVQINDLDQLSDVLDMWGVTNRPSQLDVERALGSVPD